MKKRRSNIVNQYFAFVGKEFIHILRDSRTLLILLGMPIVEMIIFGFALNMEVNNVRTVILDQSQDRLSHQITTTIAQNQYFLLQDVVYSYEDVDEALRKSEADLAIVIPPNLESDLLKVGETGIQVIADASDPNMATIATGYVGGAIANLFPSDGGGYRVDVNSYMLYNPLLKSSFNFVPGLMGLVLVIICVLMTSVSIVREKERGTMEVLLSSPVRPSVMVLAKTVPYFVVSCINLISILLLSYFVLKVPIRGSLFLIIFLTMIYIFLSLGIGMLISTLVRTQVAAILLSGFVMMMPTLILSGMIFPIENMPSVLQWLSYIIPARWYIDAVKKVMIQGLSFFAVWKEMVILISMSAVFFVASILNIKPRLK